VQAHLLGETKMADSLDFPVSYIAQAKDTLAFSRATDLKVYMDENKGTLTEIKDEDIVDMDKVITKFGEVMNLPESDIKTRKSEGTEQIVQIITKLETDKAMIGKLIHSYFESMEDNWMTESRIGLPKGIRHTSIQYKFMDTETGVPVIKVKCTLTKGDLSEVIYTTKIAWKSAIGR
jgi:hypothetical protein